MYLWLHSMNGTYETVGTHAMAQNDVLTITTVM